MSLIKGSEMPSEPKMDSFKLFIVKMTALQSTEFSLKSEKAQAVLALISVAYKFMFSRDFTKACLPIFAKKV